MKDFVICWRIGGGELAFHPVPTDWATVCCAIRDLQQVQPDRFFFPMPRRLILPGV